MSKHIISVAFALLVVLVTAAIVGAQLMIVPETASIDDPIAIAIEPAWVNHSTLRIDEGGAFYRANVDQETMLFTARRPGTHRVTLVDTETGATLEEASILVTASEKPVEIPTVEPAPIDIPVEEPQAVVNESSPEIIIEPIVETVIEAPQSVVAPTPPRVRPTVPLLTWDRAPGRGVPDGLARARAQTSLPNITVDDIRRDARGRYDMRLRAAGYNALEIRGADALPTNNGVEFMAPMGTSTDIVLVEGVQIENATVRLAKDSQVDAIARCDGFLPDGTCSGWTTTDIAFTDFGSYVEFTVPHFSGYAGVNNATYFFVENTTLMPTATANRVHVNLTFSDPSGSQWLIIAASEYIMNITTIEGRVYLTRDYATIVAMMAKRVT